VRTLTREERALAAATLRKAADKLARMSDQPKWTRVKGSEEKAFVQMERSIYDKVVSLLRQWADQTIHSRERQ
jgi:hypothetical protein